MIQVQLKNTILHPQRGRNFSLLLYDWGNWGLRKFLKMAKAIEWVRRDGTQTHQESDSRAYPKCCRPSPPWIQVSFILLWSMVGIERSKRQQGGYKSRTGRQMTHHKIGMQLISFTHHFAWSWIIGIRYFWVTKSGRRQYQSWDLENLELKIYFIYQLMQVSWSQNRTLNTNWIELSCILIISRNSNMTPALQSKRTFVF